MLSRQARRSPNLLKSQRGKAFPGTSQPSRMVSETSTPCLQQLMHCKACRVDLPQSRRSRSVVSARGLRYKTRETEHQFLAPVQNLLNPCRCRTGGKCTCCRPIVGEGSDGPHARDDGTPEVPVMGSLNASNGPGSTSGSRTPLEQFRTRNSSTDNLAEMFKQKATTDPGITATLPSVRSSGHYHPAHTNPHVHKTKLFSPYDNASGSIAAQRRGSDLSRRSSARSQAPNMNHRVSNETLMPEPHIPPLNPAFLAGATTEATLPSIDFPTGSMIHLSGCTCGDDCRCPGCGMHGIPEEAAQPGTGDVEMNAAHNCPDSCTS